MSKSVASAALLTLGLATASGLWACSNYYDQPEYAYVTTPSYRGYSSPGERPAPVPGSTVSFIACPTRTAEGCVTARDKVGVTWDVGGANVPADEAGYAIRYRGTVTGTGVCGVPALEDMTWVRSEQVCPQG
jgi:hypothetical protein